MTPRLPLRDLRVRAALLVAGLTLFLVAMAGHHLIQRATGQEVRIAAEPVDPRSLFRGYYVIIRTPLHRLDLGRLAGNDEFEAGDKVFVFLTEDAEAGVWTPISVSNSRPRARQPDTVMIEGRVEYATVAMDVTGPGDAQGPFLGVRYNLESYFADADRAKELEDAVRDGEMKIIVSVTNSGPALMKGVELAGVAYYDSIF